VPLAVSAPTLDSPHTKADLLLQAHLERAPLSISGYVTDTKSVLDQALRLHQALRMRNPSSSSASALNERSLPLQ
jgi:hypothetical protein